MKIKVGANGYVEGFVTVGDMDGAVAYTGEISAGFDAETCRYYRLVDGALVYDAAKKEAEERHHHDAIRIAELKNALAETDYQIIKCYEYALAGLPAPYDAEALHAERQTRRDEINELEGAGHGGAGCKRILETAEDYKDLM